MEGGYVMSIEQTFRDHERVIAEAATRLVDVVEHVSAELHQCFARGNKLLVCGNGGSASDAEHLVAELVGRYKDDRQALAALALSAGGTATLTAVSNDYGYETVFARQVEALARPGDLLFAISTSGNSPNVIAAVTAARARDCRVVAFTGESGGRLGPMADLLVAAPSRTTARIQEVHGLCIHAICESLDRRLGVGGQA
jgi:D-sedoheptulose 7-phosphate isomerase